MKNNTLLFSCLIIYVLGTFVAAGQEWKPLGPNDDDWPSLDEVEYIDFAFAPDGTPYMSYMDYEYNEEVTVSKYNLTTQKWEIVGERGISEDYVEYTSIVVDANGTPYVAYADDEFDNAIFVKYFDGTDWVDLGVTPISCTASDKMELAFDSTGVLYIVYEDDDEDDELTMQRYYQDQWEVVGGSGFSTDDADEFQFVISDTDVPYIFYEDYTTGIMLYTYNTTAAAWETIDTTNFPSSDIDYFSMAIASNGDVYISYGDDDNNGKLAVSRYSTTGWEAIGVDLTTDNINENFIGISSNDEIYVMYNHDHDEDNDTSDKISVKTYNATSNTWEFVGPVGISVGNTDYGLIAFNPEGKLFVVYQDNNIDDYAVLSEYNPTTNLWSYVGTPGFTVAEADDMISKFSSNGTLYTAYSDDAADRKLSVVTYNEASKSWEYVGTQGFSPDFAGFMDIEFDSQQQPYVMFRNDGNAIMVFYFDGTAWSQVGNVNANAPTDYVEMSIDSNDNIYIAHQDNYVSGGLSVEKYDRQSQSWSTMPYTDLKSGSNNIDMIIDSSDIPYVVSNYSDGGAKGIVSKFNATTNAWEQVGPYAVETSNPNRPVLQVDSNDELYLAYTDYNAGGATVVHYNSTSNEWETIGSSFPIDYEMTFTITDANSMYIGYSSDEKPSVRKYNTSTNTWDLVGDEGFSFTEVNEASLAVFDDDKMVMTYQKGFAYAKIYSTLIDENNDGIDDTHFVTTWTVTDASSTVNIPLNPAYTYNFDVDWDGDGVFDETGLTGEAIAGVGAKVASHDYGAAGTYTVVIRGDFPAMQTFYLNDINDRAKITSVEQWGTNKWQTMEKMFRHASYLTINAEDNPDLSEVTSMNGMFFASWTMNTDLSDWDFSNIDDMTQMFYGASSFDQSLANWNIENVTNMTNMLQAAEISTENYDATLAAWSAKTLPSGMVFSAGNSLYCESGTERQKIIDDFGWTITDGGLCAEKQTPVITSFSPETAAVGDTIVITGEYFLNITEVTIGGVAVTDFTVDNEGQITLVVPEGAEGIISITNGNGTATSTTELTIFNDVDNDGVEDRVDNCANTANPNQENSDDDNMGDACDTDDDNDGTLDTDDAFPLDPTEDTDTDLDGTGNNADLDDDDDDTPDTEDDFPLDATEDTDTDLDGTGNNADLDDDDDDTPDTEDDFPLDATEDTDTDLDGTGNNADLDDDDDGTPDTEDVFPLDATEDKDTDLDGIGDNADTDDERESKLVPAEAFTPNGDGNNDSWVIPGIENYPNNTVHVLNRWGKEVFSTQSYSNNWEGFYKNNNEKLPPGQYMYIIDLGDNSKPIQGWIFLNY